MADIAEAQESELLARCLEGVDAEAWEQFVRVYSGLVWSSIRRTFSSYSFRYSNEDIEDIYGTVFHDLVENDFRKIRQFRGKNACSLSTWLAIVAVRKTIDFLRKDKRHLFIKAGEEEGYIWEAIPENSRRVDDLLEERETRALIEKAARGLARNDRLIYRLLYEKGCSVEEAARILGLQQDHIYSRRHRIIEKIKKMLEAM